MSPLTALAPELQQPAHQKDPHPAHLLCRLNRHHRHCAHPFALGRCEQLYPRDGTLHPFRNIRCSSTTGVDLAALLNPESYTTAVADNTNVGTTSASSTPEGMVTVRELLSQLTEDNSSVNDLASLKKYLDSSECTISEDAASIEYTYGTVPLIYRQHKNGTVRQIFPGQQPFCAEQHHLCRRHRLFHDQPERVYRDGRRAFAVRRSVRCQGRPLAEKLQRGRSCAEFGWQHQRLRSFIFWALRTTA